VKKYVDGSGILKPKIVSEHCRDRDKKRHMYMELLERKWYENGEEEAKLFKQAEKHWDNFFLPLQKYCLKYNDREKICKENNTTNDTELTFQVFKTTMGIK
jgi:hypothetical protein